MEVTGAPPHRTVTLLAITHKKRYIMAVIEARCCGTRKRSILSIGVRPTPVDALFDHEV